ncbi:MAG TPA: cupin domain-containing protein [Opitutaceae bacterium]|nr:cupin domain-containing protein [Opitutaceae bacterium]
MKKINLRDIPEEPWASPKGKFASADRNISIKLGRDPGSTDLCMRHPFDVEICRIPPGKSACPYHSHSAQWEFYLVLAGTGAVRDPDGRTAVEAGDAFIFEPGRPHQLTNDSSADLVVYVVADNPLGETSHYPDSGKWLVRSPERAVIRSVPLDYFDGEE